MLECRGAVKPLPPPSGSEPWKLELAAGSLIPYVTDGQKKLWAMEVFQQVDSSTPVVSDRLPDLDLNAVVPSTSSAPSPVPIAPMVGLTPRNLTHQLSFRCTCS